MNNAAMSGTHYPLDKEPRGLKQREEDDKVINTKDYTEGPRLTRILGLGKNCVT